nr:protein enabled homolog [Coffea arabica]
MEDGEDLTPFWVPSTSNRGRVRRFRHGLSSFFLSSGLLVSVLLITAVSFLVLVVPATISFSSQIFRPNNVKKSWDSLNLVLVLVALVFGFLSRNKNEDRNFEEYHDTTPTTTRTETRKSNPSTAQGWYNYSPIEAEKTHQSNPLQWHGYSDQTAYNSTSSTDNQGGLLRRTYSSYPDLLVASSRLASGDDPWMCYDDMIIETPRYSRTGELHRRRSWKYTFDDSQLESKNFYVDKFAYPHPQERPSNTPATPPPSSPPPAPPSPPPESPLLRPASPPLDNEKPKRVHQSVAHRRERRRKRRDSQMENNEPISEPATPPPPPPPPPPLPQFVDQKSGKSEKKRTGGNATKDFLNSLYHKKKKKRQRQKSVENFDALLNEPQMPPLHLQLPPQSPPPPPPPPPPPSVLQNLFASKKSKGKTTHTVISVPIPQLPSRHQPTQKALQPVKVRSFDSEEGNSNSGGESPLVPIPPPPPPPPFFKSPAWKFVLQGDYVRVNSNLSSRSGSPDLDDVESDGTPTAAADGGDMTPFAASPLFCPSPDVDSKAESFISRFRAGLKLEKIDSMNKRHGVGFSNLGPGSGPTDI